MNRIVSPSAIGGILDAPPSKSLTQRAIAAGLLSSGTTIIRNLSFCDDSLAAMHIAEKLGAEITKGDDFISIKGCMKAVSGQTLNCGESGLAMRMFSPIAAFLCDRSTFTGKGTLVKRPVAMISEALSQLGVTVETSSGFLPFIISGKLRGGKAVIDGSSGSQLLTGLLMTLPLLDSDSEIVVHNLRSKPYISLTLKLLEDFGINIDNKDLSQFKIRGNQKYFAHEYLVEGDWSGAAFLLVAGAVSGDVTVFNLNPDSLQADRVVIDVMKRAGAKIEIEGMEVRIQKSGLKAFSFDATDSPDLFPPLAALACHCKGTSIIKGVKRLEHKESDRAMAIMQVLGALNIKAYIVDDDLFIDGGEVRGAIVSSYGDHRIAMMAAVAGLAGNGPVVITGAEAVTKSFPGFFEILLHAGVSVS